MKVKQSKFKEISKAALATVVAVALFGGLLWGINTRTLHGATQGETYVSQTVEEVRIPDHPVPEEPETINLAAVTNITAKEVAISPSALSEDDAAWIGATYILEVFGVCIEGMYMELEFTGWDRTTRALWSGVVSHEDRNSIVRMQRANELHDDFMTRRNAGADRETIAIEWESMMENYRYVPGYFYFIIDAVTGERIDIWRNQEAMRGFVTDADDIITRYVYREWRGDWQAAITADVTPDDIARFSKIAADYTQRHFNNTTVSSVAFSWAVSSLIVEGDMNIMRQNSLIYTVMDDTGRVAQVTVCQHSSTVTAIHTSRNDQLLMEIGFPYNWITYEHPLFEDDSAAIRRIREAEYGIEEYIIIPPPRVER